MFSSFTSIIAYLSLHATALVGALPSHCPICQLPQSGSLFCDYCYSSLSKTESGCFQCAEPLPELLSLNIANSASQQFLRCGRCQKLPPSFDQVIAKLAYREPLSKLIQGYKFSHQLNLLPSLADCLIQQIQSVSMEKYQLPDALIAVPLHPQRLRQRGFNQSLMLANRVSKHFKIPVLKDLVIRTKQTGEQASLNRKQRSRNIANAFEIPANSKTIVSKYKKVAIIDDVITSGSTCNEVAKTLKKAGITFVDTWCIAKTPFIK